MNTKAKSLKVQVGGNHYKDMAIQPIEFTMKNKLGFLEGNIIKYVSRHLSKNGKQDLEKAKHYIELALDHYYPEKELKKKVTPKKKPVAAFMKTFTPSSDLAVIVGSRPLRRTEVMQKMWAYIKLNKLQDVKNLRLINADEKLLKVFKNRKQVTMFEMAKLVSDQLK